MLEQLLGHLHNWFIDRTVSGSFDIRNGSIDVDGMQDGQWFRIIGSVFNDGLHLAPANDLHDESFNGKVQLLAVPQAVVSLAEDIKAWCDDNAKALASPYTSESFGGYSYSKAADSFGGTGAPLGWQYQFRSRINEWKKLA